MPDACGTPADKTAESNESSPPPVLSSTLPTIHANHLAGRYQTIESMPCHYTSTTNAARSRAKVSSASRVENLYNGLVSHRNMVQLASLLAELSAHKPDNASQYSVHELAFKGISAGMTTGGIVTVDIRLEAMLDVARRSQEYAAGNMNAEAIVKLKLMLSYLTLYLTMEHGILPWMRADHGVFVSDRTLDSGKLQVLQSRLAQQGKNLKLGTLKDNVRYGKVLWNVVSMLGVLGLPMLAICGPAVTTLCKENGMTSNHMEVLGSRLACNTTWMCLCQAWAAIAIEGIFTNSARVYSTNQLLRLLLTQPLPAGSIYRLSSYYLSCSSKTPPVRDIALRTPQVTLTHQEAANVLNNMGLELEVHLFPQNNYRNMTMRSVKLVDWLLAQDGEEELVMAEDDAKPAAKRITSIALKEFGTLLPPEQIGHELVGFLGALWNSRALPGWGMISPLESQGLMLGEYGGDPKVALTVLLGGRRYGIKYENVIVPVMVNGVTLPLHISLIERCATLYQTYDTRAPTPASEEKMRVSQASSLVVIYYLLYYR